MKMQSTWLPGGLALAAAILLGSGCASPKINWDARVGRTSYDDVVVEFGPPDKQATLQNGTVVAEWITRRGGRTTVVGGYYGWPEVYPYGGYAVPPPVYADYYTPDFLLRLTFAPDGKLQSWKKVRR
jgi:hypothetical protein